MVTKSDKRKIVNKNTNFNNVENIVNGDIYYYVTNNIIDMSSSYEAITEKMDYQDFYKKYINKFEELKNYAYDISFPFFYKNKYEFTSLPLLLGKKLINWLFGMNKFPAKDLLKFYENLRQDFEFNDKSLICKRWNANFLYFSGNFREANEAYITLLEDAIESKYVPSWYLDDICIDGRNILHQYEGTLNKFSFDNEFQKYLNENKHKLSYPDIDRIKAEIFENVSKTIFENQTKSKNTIIYGIGLERCFEQIQNLLYLTIFYGSITHLRLIRELLSNIMYMYSITFEDVEFYKLTLKMLFLSGKFKEYRKLYDKLELKYDFINSKDYIESLFKFNDILFEFEIDKSNIFLLDVYGRYISNKEFTDLLNNVYDVINPENNYPFELISSGLKSIGKNIKRVDNINMILNILKQYFEKNYSRFYIDFETIINEIDVEKLSDIEFDNYKVLIDLLLENKEHINFSVSECIIKIKKRDKKNIKYDEYLNKENSVENLLYKLEIENNELGAIKHINNILKERHEEREKNPGVFKTYFDEYNIGTNIFAKENYKGDIKEFILKDYLPLALLIISSENEIIYEKIKHIKLLAHLLMVEDYEIVENIIKNIQECRSVLVKEHSIAFENLKNKDNIDLEINIIMCNVIASKLKYKDALNRYIEIAINNENNIEEILSCIDILNTYYKSFTEDVLEKLFILFNICYKKNDIDIRNQTIIFSNVFMKNKKYKNIIYKMLDERVKILTFKEARGYINLILKSEDKKIYSNIIKELKNNRNFYIKYMSNKYL